MTSGQWALGILHTLTKELGRPIDLVCKAETLYIEYDWGNDLFPYYTDEKIILEILKARRLRVHEERKAPGYRDGDDSGQTPGHG